MDALSYMLQTVRLRATCYANVCLSPPWGVHIPQTDAGAFHAVVSGRCWFRINDGEPRVELEQGDVVVLPHGEAHTFCDDPSSPVRVLDNIRRDADPVHPPHRPPAPSSAEPDATTVLCGHLWFDDQMANPLVRTLPPLVHLRAASEGRPAGWLEPVLHAAILENDARTPGADAVLTRLSELIVIQGIRAHLNELPSNGRGWLHALADPQLSAALGLIHEHPDTPWTVAGLASQVGLSRSTLAARFTRVLGQPPLQYLTYWRMEYAQRLLQTSTASVADIGAQVGYQTEPAFSRAFKQWVGVPPGAYRRNRSLGTVGR